MNITPNTPANADIAREASLYLRDSLFTPLLISAVKPTEAEFLFDISSAIQSAIAKAIERDRAERDAELTRLREELGKSIDRELAQAKQLAEQSAALAIALPELERIRDEVSGAMNNAAPEEAPDILDHVGNIAKQAIAQIEALAGGTPSSKGTFSSGGKGLS